MSNVIPQNFIKHEVENEGDWSEWVNPNSEQYFMKCCDCGLVHEMQFKVAKYSENDECEFVEDANLQAVFRARRTTPPAAVVQDLPFGVSGGLVAIKTLLSRDPCVHANTAIEMIDAILKEHPAAPVQEPVQLTIPEGMVLVPYEPSTEMQEQGSTASGYDLSQKRARHVYQSMIDMHVVREGKQARSAPVQEPDWLDKQRLETDWDHVWLLVKAASYAGSRGHISGTTNWGAAMSAYLRHETPPAAPVQEPESFEQWNAKQHGDPEEIGFLQALRIAYCAGQDSVTKTTPPTAPVQEPIKPDTLSLEQLLRAAVYWGATYAKGDYHDALEGKIYQWISLRSGATPPAAPVQEPESFEQWNAKQHADPGGNLSVALVKQEFANLVDNLNLRRQEATDAEVKRMLSIAITEAQTAQMWAVKAITWSHS